MEKELTGQPSGVLNELPSSPDRPQVSVIIPTYNNAHFLPEALESVFRQDYDAYEIIIVDDGSTDNTVEVLNSYADRLRYLKQDNAGSASARNTGLTLARGEFVVFLDADDVMLPGKLRQQAAYLTVKPSLGYVHSGWRLIDETGGVIDEAHPWQDAPVLNLQTWLSYKPMNFGALMFRRVWLDAIGGLDPALRQSHDVDLLLRLSLAGCRGEWIYAPTVGYRQHGENTTRKNALTQAKSVVAVLNKFFAYPNVPDEVRDQESKTYHYTALWLVWHLFQSGFASETVPYLQLSLAHTQFDAPRTVFEWLKHFLKWTAADGRSETEIRRMWPQFEQVVAPSFDDWPGLERYLNWWLGRRPFPDYWPYVVPESSWPLFAAALDGERKEKLPTAEMALDFWVDVWLPYVWGNYPMAGRELGRFDGLTENVYLQLLVFSMGQHEGEITTTLAHKLWRDGRARGLLSGVDDAHFFRSIPTFRRPKVSVIIPTYNNACFIEETIDSVLAQTFTDFEIIVIDDGSQDETAAVLAKYDGRIRAFFQENQGVSAARNYGLSLAHGEFVLFLDSDDVLLPSKLEDQVALLASDEALGVVHSGWRLVDETGQLLRDVEPWRQAPNLDISDWLMWKPVFLGAMLFRRSWLDNTDGFDAPLHQAEDTDLMLRLALAGCPMTWLQQPTIHYRQHGNNTTHHGLGQAEDMCLVLDKFYARPDLPEEVRQSESAVRFYTLIWLVWQLHRTDFEDAIPTYLQKLVPVTKATDRIFILRRWLSQLTVYALAERVDLSELRAFWPYFQMALEINEHEWPMYEELLDRWLRVGPDDVLLLDPSDDVASLIHFAALKARHEHVPAARAWLCWWLDVWQHYLYGDRQQARENLSSFRHLRAEVIVSLAQASIVRRPNDLGVTQISAFWQDVTETKVLRPTDPIDETGLYLTYSGQAALGRHWRRAWSGLLPTLKKGLQPKARRAWVRFYQRAFDYFRSSQRLNESSPVQPAQLWGPETFRSDLLTSVKSKRATILLIAWIVLISFFHIKWIQYDTRPQPFVDPYPLKTLLFVDAVKEQGFSHIFQLISEMSVGFRPPLYQLLTVPAIVFVERSIDAMLVVNVLAIAVLALAVFQLGRLGKNNTAGLLAAAIVTTYPPIVSLTKIARPHSVAPAAAAVCLWFLFFLLKNRSVKIAWLLGISLGVAFLIHPNLLYVLPVPVMVLSLYMVFYPKRPNASQNEDQAWSGLLAKLGDPFVLKGLLPAGVITILFTAVWYLPNRLVLLEQLQNSAASWSNVRYGFQNVPASFWWYAQTAPGAISHFFAILLGFSLVAALIKRRTFPLLMTVVFLLMYCGISLREGTLAWMNGVAILPLAAVLTAIFVVDLRDFAFRLDGKARPVKPLRNLVAFGRQNLLFTVCVLLAALNFSLVNWGIPAGGESLARALGMPLDSACGWRMVVAYCPDPPRAENWKTDEILLSILNDPGCQDNDCSLAVVSESAGNISHIAITYYQVRDFPDSTLEIVPIRYGGQDNINWLTSEFLFYIPELDNHAYSTAVTKLLEDLPESLAEKYREIGRHALPRNWTAVLLKRIEPLTVSEAEQLIDMLDISQTEKNNLVEEASLHLPVTSLPSGIKQQ